MADIRDYQAAARETDDALLNLRAAQGLAQEKTSDYGSLAVALGLEAVALAIREASVRSDYVTRDIMRGRP